ncbi:MAG: glycosyltransferase [Candidatus Bathyarchaeota archaeon]|nr:glycosyltransferase [Candidatus Bathyarchaeota archaeon]
MFEIAMINDCAYVGETLLKYLPASVKGKHVKRSRNLWSKTLGLAYNIMRIKADIYHVHYLLQDCYIAAKLGKKPLIGHAHGSDLRSSLNHPLWGRIVRYNLRKCDKVLVSTPDILGIAKKFREDAEYLPNPVDTELFYPKPVAKHDGKKKVLIASDSNWKVKGTDVAIRALSKIRDEVEVSIIKYGTDFNKTLSLASSLGLHLNILPRVSHEKLKQYYWYADVVIDRFKLGSLGVVSLEAIACGRPVISYVSSTFQEYSNFPLKNVNTEENIVNIIMETDTRLWELWEREYAYLLKEHKVSVVIKKLLKIYDHLFR